MEKTNWPELTKLLSSELKNLRGGAPEMMKAFSSMAQAALAPGALDPKTKELIALGIAVAVRCEDCIAFHVKAAVDQGAAREEVLERWPVRDVREPRTRRLYSIRRGEVDR